MIEGRIRSAVILVTDRSDCGVFPPEAVAQNGPLGISVYDKFKEKHPVQRIVDPSTFIECKELPPFEHVDITSSETSIWKRRPQWYKLRAMAGLYGSLWNS